MKHLFFAAMALSVGVLLTACGGGGGGGGSRPTIVEPPPDPTAEPGIPPRHGTLYHTPAKGPRTDRCASCLRQGPDRQGRADRDRRQHRRLHAKS